jgi:hypothetical protein
MMVRTFRSGKYHFQVQQEMGRVGVRALVTALVTAAGVQGVLSNADFFVKSVSYSINLRMRSTRLIAMTPSDSGHVSLPQRPEAADGTNGMSFSLADGRS